MGQGVLEVNGYLPTPNSQTLRLEAGSWRLAAGNCLERHPRHDLERTWRRHAVDRAEPVLVRDRAARVGRQVRDRPVGQAGEVDRCVHPRELRVVQGVEHVRPHLEHDPLEDSDFLRQREIDVVDRRTADEEACRFIAVAARLRRSKARRLELLVRVAAPSAPRVAREDDSGVWIAVGAGEVRGIDVRDAEVHRVRPAAHPSIDARNLPVVHGHTERTAGESRYLVDEVDDEVVRPIIIQ